MPASVSRRVVTVSVLTHAAFYASLWPLALPLLVVARTPLRGTAPIMQGSSAAGARASKTETERKRWHEIALRREESNNG